MGAAAFFVSFAACLVTGFADDLIIAFAMVG
jgi:hypothetical protein